MDPDVEACPAPPEEHKGSCLPAHCNRRKGEEWMCGLRHGGRVSGPRAAASSGRGGPGGREAGGPCLGPGGPVAGAAAAACELASTRARVNAAAQNGVSAMGRRKAGAGGGHAAVLSAGAGWEARRAAGLGVRPETAAEATGRPPGKSLGASCSRPIHWRLSTQGGLESDSLFTKDAAGWDCPCTGGAQINGDWRATRQTHKTRRAWVFHTLEAFNSL